MNIYETPQDEELNVAYCSLGGIGRLPQPRFKSLFNSNLSAYLLLIMIRFLLGWSSFLFF